MRHGSSTQAGETREPVRVASRRGIDLLLVPVGEDHFGGPLQAVLSPSPASFKLGALHVRYRDPPWNGDIAAWFWRTGNRDNGWRWLEEDDPRLKARPRGIADPEVQRLVRLLRDLVALEVHRLAMEIVEASVLLPRWASDSGELSIKTGRGMPLRHRVDRGVLTAMVDALDAHAGERRTQVVEDGAELFLAHLHFTRIELDVTPDPPSAQEMVRARRRVREAAADPRLEALLGPFL